MMGAYFGITGLGNKAAGLLGEVAADSGEMAVFIFISVACLAIAVLLFFIKNKLNKLTHGAEEDLVQA